MTCGDLTMAQGAYSSSPCARGGVPQWCAGAELLIADGDVKAVFEGLAQDAGQAGKDIGDSAGEFTDQTAARADKAASDQLEADAKTAEAAKSGRQTG